MSAISFLLLVLLVTVRCIAQGCSYCWYSEMTDAASLGVVCVLTVVANPEL